jgi:hypothetical protein
MLVLSLEIAVTARRIIVTARKNRVTLSKFSVTTSRHPGDSTVIRQRSFLASIRI